jgi:hypothetical protein
MDQSVNRSSSGDICEVGGALNSLYMMPVVPQFWGCVAFLGEQLAMKMINVPYIIHHLNFYLRQHFKDWTFSTFR